MLLYKASYLREYYCLLLSNRVIGVRFNNTNILQQTMQYNSGSGYFQQMMHLFFWPAYWLIFWGCCTIY